MFEIDGASNNSVDQIRDLRENVTYMPSSAKYKIYIIDEVHMLSTAAFNALLKTLEEPPEHVMFIFATTEVHKIPATILSRCQRHDLGRISLEMISNHLQNLCKREEFSIEKQSLDLIAQEADGSIRDALSLLDRLLSSATTKKIEPVHVLDSLGIQDHQILHDISAAIFENNGADLIEIIEKVNESGTDLKKFYSDIILHFRNLNVIKICGKESPAVNITDSEKEKISRTVSALSSNFINTILQILLDEESIVKYSSHTKTAIEMILVKLLQINPGAQIDTIISKLSMLADQINSGQINSGQINSDQENSKLSSAQHKFEPTQKSAANNPTDKKNEIQAVREPVPTPGYTADLKTSQTQDQTQGQKQDKNRQTRTWQNFLNKIERTLPFMFALLSKGKVNQTQTREIIVELENSSSFDKARLEKKKQELQEACKEFLGKSLTIKILSQNNNTSQNNKKKNDLKSRQAAFNHPLVVEAQKIFNGEIINY